MYLFHTYVYFNSIKNLKSKDKNKCFCGLLIRFKDVLIIFNILENSISLFKQKFHFYEFSYINKKLLTSKNCCIVL